MKIVMFVLGTCMLLSFTGNDLLTGRWQSPPSEKGNVTSVVFKPDTAFEDLLTESHLLQALRIRFEGFKI